MKKCLLILLIPFTFSAQKNYTKLFYADESNRQLEFTLDAKGNVVKIWFINNEQKGEMKKVMAQ